LSKFLQDLNTLYIHFNKQTSCSLNYLEIRTIDQQH